MDEGESAEKSEGSDAPTNAEGENPSSNISPEAHGEASGGLDELVAATTDLSSSTTTTTGLGPQEQPARTRATENFPSQAPALDCGATGERDRQLVQVGRSKNASVGGGGAKSGDIESPVSGGIGGGGGDSGLGCSSYSSSSSGGPLRKGKWTAEEEAFTSCIIDSFSKGYLPVRAGTTLRSYLSDKLHCDPMRITKKFAGDSSIGKQVFTPCNADDPSVVHTRDSARLRMDQLEAAFRQRLSQKKAASAAAASSSLSRPRSNSSSSASSSCSGSGGGSGSGRAPSLSSLQPPSSSSSVSSAAQGPEVRMAAVAAATRALAGFPLPPSSPPRPHQQHSYQPLSPLSRTGGGGGGEGSGDEFTSNQPLSPATTSAAIALTLSATLNRRNRHQAAVVDDDAGWGNGPVYDGGDGGGCGEVGGGGGDGAWPFLSSSFGGEDGSYFGNHLIDQGGGGGGGDRLSTGGDDQQEGSGSSDPPLLGTNRTRTRSVSGGVVGLGLGRRASWSGACGGGRDESRHHQHRRPRRSTGWNRNFSGGDLDAFASPTPVTFDPHHRARPPSPRLAQLLASAQSQEQQQQQQQQSSSTPTMGLPMGRPRIYSDADRDAGGLLMGFFSAVRGTRKSASSGDLQGYFENSGKTARSSDRHSSDGSSSSSSSSGSSSGGSPSRGTLNDQQQQPRPLQSPQALSPSPLPPLASASAADTVSAGEGREKVADRGDDEDRKAAEGEEGQPPQLLAATSSSSLLSAHGLLADAASDAAAAAAASVQGAQASSLVVTPTPDDSGNVLDPTSSSSFLSPDDVVVVVAPLSHEEGGSSGGGGLQLSADSLLLIPTPESDVGPSSPAPSPEEPRQRNDEDEEEAGKSHWENQPFNLPTSPVLSAPSSLPPSSTETSRTPSLKRKVAPSAAEGEESP